VLEQSQHPARLAVHVDVERRPQEAPAANPEPAANDLEPAALQPCEALDLEGHPGGGRGGRNGAGGVA
jgi:hypothetical protein